MNLEDKKANVEFWDEIDDLAIDYLERFLEKGHVPTPDEGIDCDQDIVVGIAKSIVETTLEELKEVGIDTDKHYPYVDCDY